MIRPGEAGGAAGLTRVGSYERRLGGSLARLFENRKDKDYMPGSSPSEKEELLERMSYQDYLINKMGMTPEAIPFLRYMGFRNNK